MKLLRRELLQILSRGGHQGEKGRRWGDGRRQLSSQPISSNCSSSVSDLCLTLPHSALQASPLTPWPPTLPGLHETCLLCIVLRTSRPLSPCTHTQWTQHNHKGPQLQDPGAGYILFLAFRAQPAPETALGMGLSWPDRGQTPQPPLPGSTWGLEREWPLSTPGAALKKTGDHAHLAGLWRGLPVWPSGS